jgi:cytochrome P450
MQDEKTPITRIQALDVASILVLSGSEATPILMTAMMWNILATPRVYKRVMQEIRDSGIIKSAADITAANTDKMPYMDAVIQESLRTDTPFATTIPRVVPAGGAMVDGYWLPGGVSPLFSMAHSVSDLLCTEHLRCTALHCWTLGIQLHRSSVVRA